MAFFTSSGQENFKLKGAERPETAGCGVLNAVCLQQLLFHAAGRDSATLSLAKRRRPGQLSWLESQAGGEAKEGGKKGDLEREGVRESFGRSGVPRG